MHGTVVLLSIANNLNDDHLRNFQGNPSRPRDIPRPRGIQAGAFSQRRRERRDDPRLSLAFGAGKRICPGRHFVDATIFIVTSSVLSVFNVTKAKDEHDNEIPVKVAVTARRGVIM